MSKQKIDIDEKVFEQMFEYAHYAHKHFNSEIAGWGHYNLNKGIYKLAPLCKQVVSGAEVDVFPDEILHNVKYNLSDMIVQWHSHVNMGVTPSNTDKTLIKEAMKLFPMLISIIVNCKGQYYAELNMSRAGSVILSEPIQIDVELIPYYNNEKISKEVLEKLSLPPVKAITSVSDKVYKDYEDWWNDSENIFIPPKNGKQQENLIPTNFKQSPAYKRGNKIYQIIVEKMFQLETDFPKLCYLNMDFDTGKIGISDAGSGTTAFIYPHSRLFVNGEASAWSKFLALIGSVNPKYQITEKEWKEKTSPEKEKTTTGS